MTISEMTTDTVIECLNIDPDEVVEARLEIAMASALSQIKGETGLTEDEIDELPDLVTAYLALVQDGYDNIGMQSDGKGISQVKESILSLHRRNLI